jgi:hypothetical protein
MGYSAMTIDYSAIAAVLSAIVAVVAVVVSARTSRKQQLLQFEQVRLQRDADVNRWAQACIELLASCESFVAVFDPTQRDRELNEQYRVMRYRLSALIDQGRLFFPNELPDSKGAHKPEAYRGVRQRILNMLVLAYEVFARYDDLPSDGERGHLATEIGEFRRHFVSEAQVAIDPRRFIELKEMNELKKEKGLEIQKPDGQEPPRPEAKILKRTLQH